MTRCQLLIRDDAGDGSGGQEWFRADRDCKSYLDETNVGGLLAEALTADVEAVLADKTSLVGADAAVKNLSVSHMFLSLMNDPNRFHIYPSSFSC